MARKPASFRYGSDPRFGKSGQFSGNTTPGPNQYKVPGLFDSLLRNKRSGDYTTFGSGPRIKPEKGDSGIVGTTEANDAYKFVSKRSPAALMFGKNFDNHLYDVSPGPGEYNIRSDKMPCKNTAVMRPGSATRRAIIPSEY